jgi:hypothetical protein
LTGGTHLLGPSSSSSQAQTRARVRPRHVLRPRGVLGPQAEAPRPPYKAAAPCPCPASLAATASPRKTLAAPRPPMQSPPRHSSVAASCCRSSALG